MAAQMLRRRLRLLPEARQCLARTFVRRERTTRYCRMRGCNETITSAIGISDAPREWNSSTSEIARTVIPGDKRIESAVIAGRDPAIHLPRKIFFGQE